METASEIIIEGTAVKVFSMSAVVVGSGASGFCAANTMIREGMEDVALITEDINFGTSRNTGSDKQTYYKLTLAGDGGDSVNEMAKNLFAGQCVDGDTALAEAALSARGFFHLVDIGVPFPSGRYGEYVGYKTDHDPRQRATSAGPYTSRMMTECLQKESQKLGLKIFDRQQVISLLHKDNFYAVLCFSDTGYTLFNCSSIVLATGGPASLYNNKVYPPSQAGASGIAFNAGIRGKNITEWQYGLASVAPPWNVSGSFMQVLPRFVSTNKEGEDAREFLQDFITGKGDLLSRTFLKGYQWPFDVRKCSDGSSLIDILVYRETVLNSRRVFLDYRVNPFEDKDIDYNIISPEAREYMQSRGICFGTPIERLRHMNEPAYQFYLGHGIDLEKDMLEVALCAQHNNGGLAADAWWQTNIEGIFAVGEACGSHGVYRPGGSALNAGQAGAMRAALYITEKRNTSPQDAGSTAKCFKEDIAAVIKQGQGFISTNSNVEELILQCQNAMDEAGASMRSREKISSALAKAKKLYSEFNEKVKIASAGEMARAYRLYDILIAQIVYLSAMENYIEEGGASRSSALYYNPKGELPAPGLPEAFRYTLSGTDLSKKVQEAEFKNGECSFFWREVNPIPKEDSFFENVWKTFRENKNIY